jgi:hypothetical protein
LRCMEEQMNVVPTPPAIDYPYCWLFARNEQVIGVHITEEMSPSPIVQCSPPSAEQISSQKNLNFNGGSLETDARRIFIAARYFCTVTEC